MDNKSNIIGKNIKCLRIIYGETQPDLADASASETCVGLIGMVAHGASHA